MNNNERMILDILSRDPLTSQAKISELLKITRSSVSVYISNLMQEGYILGRGYLLNAQNTVYVIGSAIIDYRTVSNSEISYDDSTLMMDDVELKVNYGGSARNISEVLVRLGNEVSCISAIGDDFQGKDLMENCKNLGIDIADVLIVPAKKTSTYLEIRSPDQQRIMFSASDTKLQHAMTPQFLMEKHYKLKHAKCIITEDGVSSESLRYLTSIYNCVFMISMKEGRTKAYRSFVNQFYGLMISLRCAYELLDIPYEENEDDENVFRIAFQIKKKIRGPLLICYGRGKACFCNEGQAIIGSYESGFPNARLYSHYRDTVAAGFIDAILQGFKGEEMLKHVFGCREIAAEAKLVVNPTICPEAVGERVKELHDGFSFAKSMYVEDAEEK